MPIETFPLDDGDTYARNLDAQDAATDLSAVLAARTYPHGEIDLVGTMWMPSDVGATAINLDSYAVRNLAAYGAGVDHAPMDGRDVRPEQITRESAETWLGMHSGDFSDVIDFRALIYPGNGFEPVEIKWDSKDNELTWSDLMSGDDE